MPIRHRKRQTHLLPGDEVWKTVHIAANLFAFEEWSTEEPASLEILSIGEEQSTSIVASIAWSPTGLAKHKRFVLAALTSNLLLSLWEPGSDPSEASSWSRVTIVNDHLQNYFQAHNASSDVPLGALRKRRRIRTMCWADELPDSVQAARGLTSILAVVNDNEEVIVLEVSSPYNQRQERWAVKALCYHSIMSKNRKILHRSCHEITWSSWVKRRDAVEALIYCKRGPDHSVFRISIKNSAVRKGNL